MMCWYDNRSLPGYLTDPFLYTCSSYIHIPSYKGPIKLQAEWSSLLFHFLAWKLPNLSDDVCGFLQFFQENDLMDPQYRPQPIFMFPMSCCQHLIYTSTTKYNLYS